MSLDIDDEILKSVGMTPDELKIELAVLLYRRGLTLGQASEVAGLSQFDFQQVLGSRQIPVHYDETDYADDVRTLGEIGRL